ncbi:MAG: HAD-IC family P-type ATPase, partial [Chlamydiae bacterium]|nr:HAD-IC family P-type ATPase [Chlamydiota bacterium]
FSAKQTLFRITRSLPQKGRRNGQMVSIKEIKVGDELQLLLGEKVVLDGVVTKGEALVDESVMTGEARLVLKRRGERLIGGSIVRKGSLYFEVTANSEGSLISQILQFIERDLSSKKQVRLIDRITPIFIPIVILLGLLSGHLLEVLLVACPCAIGIAVPLIESRLIKRFADEGVLIRNRDALFRLGDDPYFIFDKTGTVTEGLFTLLSEPPKNPLIGRMAASTIHPAAQPLAEGKPLEVEEVIGRGLIFEDALLGSSRFLQERGVTVPTIASEHSLLFFAKGGSYQEHFEVGDRLRPFPKLNGLLLSGDRKEVVKRVADQLGLQWKAECDPLQKREVIQNITQTTVMVGDGVNDASALAAADVGISVTSGSDVSLQVADMVVSDLEALPALVALSKKGRRIARQNLFWAFSFNIVGIALAMLGLLQPLFAAAAMALSSLAVVISTARIDKKGGLKQLTSWNLHSGSEQRDVETKSVTL